MDTDFSSPIAQLEQIVNESQTEEARAARRNALLLSERLSIAGEVLSAKEILALANQEMSRELYLRQDSPYYLNHGEQQLVLRLGNSWVAKVANHFRFDAYFGIKLSPNYTSRNQGTILFLSQEFGFEIPFAIGYFNIVHGNHRFTISKRGNGTFMLVPDLTENGQYVVRDIPPDEDFRSFVNGAELKEVYESYIQKLIELYHKYEVKDSKLPWAAEINRHNEKGDARTAFRKLFFLQISPENFARVVPGDFDHVWFYRRDK